MADVTTAQHHNSIVARAHERAGELEPRVADVVAPLIEKAGEDAAAAFLKHAYQAVSDGADRAIQERLALAAAAPTPTSTMICVKPRADEAARLALPSGIPADELHVTLVSVGDYTGDLEVLADALRSVAAQHAPLAGLVAGVGAFVGQDDVSPLILLPDVPGLVELRVDVTEALAAAGISYARDHGFEAHITAAYDPDVTSNEPLLDAVGVPLHFDDLLVVRGDVEVVPLALTGAKPLTAAGATPEQARHDLMAAFDRLDRALDSGNQAAIARAKTDVQNARERLARAAGAGANWSAPAPGDLLDTAALAESLSNKLYPVRLAVAESVMKPTLDELGIDFDADNPLVGQAVASSSQHITSVADTTRADVLAIVHASYQEGLSIREASKAIRVGMRASSGYRARMIARTELAGVVNASSLAGVRIVSRTTGDSYSKEWLTGGGAKHPRHELYVGLNHQVVALDAPFEVGGYQLQYPGDPSGPAHEVINCRCAVAYREGSAAVPGPPGLR